MRNFLAVVAALTAAMLLADSVYRFFRRNTKRYLRDEMFDV